MTKVSQKKKRKNRNLLIILFSVLVVCGLFFLNWYLLHDLEPNNRGTLGDMFGVANALFSGLALAGIVITLWLQQQELKSQQTDINDQKKEINLQRFETSYFNQLNFHHSIVKETCFEKENGDVINGKSAFKDHYDILSTDPYINDMEKSIQYMQEADLIYYFKYIYRVVKFVNMNTFDWEKEEEQRKAKYRYVQVLRSKLSKYELLLIFYFGLTKDGAEFKELIEDYTLLKNTPESFKEKLTFKEKYHIQAFIPKPKLPEKSRKQTKV